MRIDHEAMRVLTKYMDERIDRLTEIILTGTLLHDPVTDANNRARIAELKDLKEHMIGEGNE